MDSRKILNLLCTKNIWLRKIYCSLRLLCLISRYDELSLHRLGETNIKSRRKASLKQQSRRRRISYQNCWNQKTSGMLNVFSKQQVMQDVWSPKSSITYRELGGLWLYPYFIKYFSQERSWCLAYWQSAFWWTIPEQDERCDSSRQIDSQLHDLKRVSCEIKYYE